MDNTTREVLKKTSGQVTEQSFETWCKSEQFKALVRQACNEKSFREALCEAFYENAVLQSKIDNSVSMKFAETERRVHDKVLNFERNIPSVVRDKTTIEVNSYLNSVLVGKVKAAVLDVLPSIVANDPTMVNLFNNHSKKLEIDLNTLATSVMQRVADEDQFHTMTSTYLMKVDERTNSKLNQMSTQADDLFNQFKKSNEEKMAELKNQLADIAKLKKNMSEIQSDISGLQTSNSIMWGFNCIAVAVIGGLFIHIFTR